MHMLDLITSSQNKLGMSVMISGFQFSYFRSYFGSCHFVFFTSCLCVFSLFFVTFGFLVCCLSFAFLVFFFSVSLWKPFYALFCFSFSSFILIYLFMYFKFLNKSEFI